MWHILLCLILVFIYIETRYHELRKEICFSHHRLSTVLDKEWFIIPMIYLIYVLSEVCLIQTILGVTLNPVVR